jgi:hypothetical protein
MRVTIPVDPYFKTASKVATLKFLSQHTSIPVPSVIAYDTSPENQLGFEWTLMTRLPGVPLKELGSSPQLLWGESKYYGNNLGLYSANADSTFRQDGKSISQWPEAPPASLGLDVDP